MSDFRPGYKQTDVGMIPDEWGVEPLGALIGSLDAGVSVRSTPEATSAALNCARVLKTSCISLGRFFPNEAKPILSADIARATTTAHGDTILISRMNTPALVGEVGYVDTDYPDLFLPDRLWMARAALGRGVSMRWLTAVLAHGDSGQVLRETATGTSGSMKNISKPALRAVLTPTPPPAEQNAIAGALGDADSLIDALEGMIAKKRAIKQGAMQDLLFGRRRLPGFEGKWKTVAVGDLGVFVKGRGVRKDEANSGNLPCVRYGELYTHHADIIRAFNSHISPVVARTALRLRQNDILFAGSGETKEEIGKCASLVDDLEAYAGGDIIVLRPRDADGRLLGYLLNMPHVQRQKASKGQGDAVVHIGARALASVEVQLPPTLNEQRAIAAVLSDMDGEIAALEEKLEKTSAVKQGMMQVLLTGEIRLT